MKKKITRIGAGKLSAAAAGAALLGLVAAAGGSEPAAPSAANRYIGADKCKSCHSSEDAGNQYAAWEAMDHSKAFETLASDRAVEIAAARGIDDPQRADECLRCHTTAFGVAEAEIKKGFDHTKGVQCESCHGPGEQHFKARFMAAAKGEAGEGYTPTPEGEIVVNPAADTCVSCHNEESPTFERFCYYEFVSKIRHLHPGKPHPPGSVMECGCDPCVCTTSCAEDDCPVPVQGTD